MNGCRINHVANTITLTKKFLHAASNPSSDECAYLQQIRTNFPNLRVTTTPATKKKSSNRPRLSYKQMRNYINCLPDGEKWIEPFEQVMQLAKSQKNPYLYTYNWFAGTFPGYENIPQFDDKGTLVYESNVIQFPTINANNTAPTAQVV
ncbi:MAG: hypothetical protein IJ418_23875 [Clostridia bacterium]|nr:hypothetical protein [Clostridia bacterium]